MTDKENPVKMKRDRAYQIASKLLIRLAPSCERIDICGSIRRNRPDVKDIELVAIPAYSEEDKMNLLDHQLAQMAQRGVIKFVKGGSKYKQFWLMRKQGDLWFRLICVDLFIVTPPAQWGVIKLIRTGSAKYSKKFATDLLKAGYCFHKGALWRKMAVVEEEEVYNHLAWEYVDPKDREV